MGRQRNISWALRTFVVLVMMLSCPHAWAVEPGPADFKFGDVDLKVLEEANEFDRQLARKGLILNDPDLNVYLEKIGKQVLGEQPALERVNFQFNLRKQRPAGTAGE